jgi:hypothetical protein
MQLFYDPELPLIPEHALCCDDEGVEGMHVRPMIIGCHAIRLWDAVGSDVGGGAVDIYEVPRDTIKNDAVIQGTFFQGRKPILSVRLPANGIYRYDLLCSGSWALWIGNVMLLVNHKCIITEKRRKTLRVSFMSHETGYADEGEGVIYQILAKANLNYTLKMSRDIDYHGYGEWEFRVCPYTSFNPDLTIAKEEMVSLMDTLDQIKLDDDLQVKLNICNLSYTYGCDYYVDDRHTRIFNDKRDFQDD